MAGKRWCFGGRTIQKRWQVRERREFVTRRHGGNLIAGEWYFVSHGVIRNVEEWPQVWNNVLGCPNNWRISKVALDGASILFVVMPTGYGALLKIPTPRRTF